MLQSSTSVIPFYESEGPPQALPLLTYHTEMFCPTLSFVLISPQEEMIFSTLPLRGLTLTPSRVFTTTSRATTPIRSRASTPKVTKLVSFSEGQFTQNSESEKVSAYSSLSSISSKDSKILKPEGEAGRPGCGGYNLEKALNWDVDCFKDLKEYIHRSIKKHCNIDKSKKLQAAAALQEVHREAPDQIRRHNQMSRLMSFFSSDDPSPEVVESHPLNELRSPSTHTYPPPTANTTLATPAISSSEECVMELDNPWQSVRRMRDDDEQRPNKVFLKEIDQSSKLREDVHELHLSKHDLLLRKHHVQITSNVRESDMQSAIAQYQQQNQYLQRDNANALASLDQNHRKEVAELQNDMALGLHKAQTETRAEIEHLLAEKEARFDCEMCLAKDRFLADNEAELARLDAKYSSKINSLDSQLRHANTASPASTPAWRHFVGKKPMATCTKIIGFSPIPDSSSESDTDEEPQTESLPLTSLLGDVPIANATVSMLAEALAKVLQTPQMTSPRGPCSRHKPPKPPVESFTDTQRRDNKANVRELFRTAFHATKDEEYMLHVSASCEAILSFAHGMGPGPDPLAMQWDMATTHNSKWNQKVIDLLCSQDDITLKFSQCHKCWRKAQPLTLSDGTRETMQQVGDRLVDQMNERLRLARVLTRRVTKFETRKKVMSTLLSDRNATGKDDQAVWAYLQSIMENLGKDGMSSDESEHEDGDVQVFRRKSMPWRADFSQEMQIIDQQRLTGATIFTPCGSKPAKRLHNVNRESSCVPIEGLPRAFYNPSWLTDQRPSFTVSKKKFQRMEIIVARQ
ncbi:uncharacterized protein HD556DRAFT_1437962 [Suillus plorans]|uniref:Uncharacterized protein n=1 Tax=Suillus plorans TaxID=116603 RepID=A0A9P7DU36_9AGAM|nr:uncharacterized protein HD556DRAFT_1437962 [Suillus plorans]KAG1802903.1 hypothetical protein HD556DRAFT_1437962 [Suillus plorans]